MGTMVFNPGSSLQKIPKIDTRMYYIEFYRKEGEPILMEYSDKENWIAILKLLDDNI